MTDIIFATSNANKVREVSMMIKDPGVHVRSLKEAGITAEIDENGSTFLENAEIKAKGIAALAKDAIVIADDSGLVIDALNGEPGIYSARYMGEDTSYDVKNRNLLERMKDVPKDKRSARFVCAMVAVLPGGEIIREEGVMEGQIAYEAAGENGFGYDPIFFLPEYGQTSAEIAPEEKNAISHRGRALRKMAERLAAYL